MDLVTELTQRLRLMGGLATIYLALVGAATWLWIRWYGAETSVAVTVACVLPVVLGAALAGTSIEDQRQYVARVLAGSMFAPLLLLFWATSLDPEAGAVARPVWPFAVGFAVVHALCFVGAIVWGGTALTAVSASGGSDAASAAQLRARLLSLNSITGPFELASGPTVDDDVVAAYRHAAGMRSHQVSMTFDSAQREVRVRERLGVAGDRPANAAEADMRLPGSPFFDPARPSADRVWSKTAQTTQIDPARLAGVPLRLSGNSAVLPKDYMVGLDGEGMVTVLCAVVTQSGWRWQPVFFGD